MYSNIFRSTSNIFRPGSDEGVSEEAVLLLPRPGDPWPGQRGRGDHDPGAAARPVRVQADAGTLRHAGQGPVLHTQLQRCPGGVREVSETPICIEYSIELTVW